MVEAGAWNDMIITDYLDKAVAEHADRPAIIGYRVFEDDRTSLSYAELNRIVTRMAAGLAGLGVKKGESVLCQLPNWLQMTALHLACVRMGALLIPLNPMFREHELRCMLGFAGSRVIVTLY